MYVMGRERNATPQPKLSTGEKMRRRPQSAPLPSSFFSLFPSGWAAAARRVEGPGMDAEPQGLAGPEQPAMTAEQGLCLVK